MVEATIAMGDAVRDELAAAMQRSYVAAYRMLGNADAARDACQEAAARALSARDRYDASRPFYPWFYRILKNHCLDRLAQRKRTVALSAEGPSAATGADDRLVSSERAQAVARAVASLPDEHREIIELRHFADASYDEIAQILDCPVGTVMSRLYRARKRLRAALARDPRFTEASGATSEGGGR